MESITTIQVQANTQRENQANFSQWMTLHQQINNLAYAPSRQELYNQALDLFIQLTSADSATYFDLDVESQELVVAAIRGDDGIQHLLGLRIPRQEALLQTALDAKEPIVIGDLHQDPGWLRIASPTSAMRMINLISLPIIAQEQPIGVIHIYNYKEANLEQLEIVRDRVSIEVDRRALLDYERLSNEQLRALIRALGQIGGTLDRKQMLQTILEQSASLVDAERTSIYLTTPGTNDPNIQLVYQPDSDRSNNTKSTYLNPQSRGSHKLTGPNRSIITVPLRTEPVDSANDGHSRQFGGLVVIKPQHTSFSDNESDLLNILVQQTSNFLQAAEIFEGMEELFFDVIESLVASMDAKDPYTQGHSKRVSEYSVLIAQKLGLEENEIHNIRIGSLIHDVGKIGIPDEILKKNGKVTQEEYAAIQGHPLTGWKILRGVRLLESMLPAILEHHEKLNGSGYPYGLHSDQISLMGRIVAVSDVFDAMTSDRPYRNAVSVPEVLKYLDENAGILFDPHCVDTLKAIVLAGNQI
jgi:HD-GYP domain-containing protein (c-di-GMP phosphodiesterase class II)